MAVGLITLGGTAYAYFAEERWGTVETEPRETTSAEHAVRALRDDEVRGSREERKQAA